MQVVGSADATRELQQYPFHRGRGDKTHFHYPRFIFDEDELD